jgi:iron complex outermembrane receptor protein
VDYSYSDSYYLYPYQLNSADPTSAVAANTLIEPSGILNLRLKLENINLWGNTASASLWVKNASDQAQIANKIDFGPGFANLTPAYFNEPRTFGLSLVMKW